MHSWKEDIPRNIQAPPSLAAIELYQDSWIRECRKHSSETTLSSSYFEFILPAKGKASIANGARFTVFGPFESLEVACLAQAWCALTLFIGKAPEKEDRLFPIEVKLPSRESVPNLLAADTLKWLQLLHRTHMLSTLQEAKFRS